MRSNPEHAGNSEEEGFTERRRKHLKEWVRDDAQGTLEDFFVVYRDFLVQSSDDPDQPVEITESKRRLVETVEELLNIIRSIRS